MMSESERLQWEIWYPTLTLNRAVMGCQSLCLSTFEDSFYILSKAITELHLQTVLKKKSSPLFPLSLTLGIILEEHSESKKPVVLLHP